MLAENPITNIMMNSFFIYCFPFKDSNLYFISLQTGNCEIKVFDALIERSTHTLEQVVNDSDYIFLAIPSQSVRQNLNNLSGAQVVEYAKNGSDNFGMYNLSADIISL